VEPQSQVAKFGNYAFNWDNQVLLYQGAQERRLTKKESDVLKMLCLNRNKLLKREDILIALWGENDYFHGRSLDVFIAQQNDPFVKVMVIGNFHDNPELLEAKPKC